MVVNSDEVLVSESSSGNILQMMETHGKLPIEISHH